MAIEPTRYSRVSVGWVSSTRSIRDADAGDSGRDFSCINGASTGSFAVTGTLSSGAFAATTGTFTSTLSANGAATLQSTLTVRGDATFSGGMFVGSAAAVNEVVAISSATAAISFGAVAANDSSSVITVALSGATRGDTILITPDSIFPVVAANRDVSFFASSSSTAGEVHVWAINSTITAVTPTASSVFRLTRINHPTYL